MKRKDDFMGNLSPNQGESRERSIGFVPKLTPFQGKSAGSLLFLLVFLLPFFLFSTGCSDDVDERAPELLTASDTLISPYDSLILRFSEEIAAFDDSHFEADPELNYKKIAEDEFGFYGDSVYPGGFQMLNSDASYEIVFSDLKDGEGNTLSELTYNFHTMPVLDSDYQLDTAGEVQNNNSIGSADMLADSVRFFESTPLSEGIKIAGVMGDKSKTVFDDHWDIYRIRLRKDDSIHLKLSGFQADLNLSFEGPRNLDPAASGVEIDPSTRVLSENSGTVAEEISVTVDANRHGLGSNVLTEYLDYWIRVYYQDTPELNESLQTPYVLEIEITQGS